MTSLEPARYPAELDGYVTVANRGRLRIRPLRRCEEAPVRDLYGRLSARTRYLRFFSAMPVLPDSVMRLLVSVDDRRRLALVALRDEAEGGDAIGLASFGAVDDGCAEVGLVVRDDWQRQGVGTELAARVLRAAEDRGFHRFVAHMLSGNVAMQKILRRLGVVVSWKMSDGVTELTFIPRQ